MTEYPRCATPEMDLVAVAKLMKDCECGAIPVVNDHKEAKPVGVITDRDIIIRTVAEGWIPSQIKVKDCMTSKTVTISPDASLEQAAKRMEESRIRRLIVVNGNGRCIGIVVQAQLARNATKKVAGELLREISQPSPELSLVKA